MLLLLPVLTGILVTISFPRAGLGWVAWVAYIPLIAFVFRAGTSTRAFGRIYRRIRCAVCAVDVDS